MIDEHFLKRLKPDAILINTARGDVIDEGALLNFITANPGARLVIDVWANEPDINNRLLEKAAISTPHIAGYSYDGKLKATRQLAAALQSYFKLEECMWKSNALKKPKISLKAP